MKPALFVRIGNVRIVADASAEIFAALAALRTKTAFVVDPKSALRHQMLTIESSKSLKNKRIFQDVRSQSPIQDQLTPFMLASDATM
jgi:hypothetical protein